MKEIVTWISKCIEENGTIIATVISIISLLIALIQAVGSKLSKRENYTVQIDNVQQFVQQQECSLLISITIINHSISPLNITRIYYCDKSGEHLCRLKKTWCGEHYYPKFPETDIPITERVFSADFPLAIEPHGAKSELIKFELPQEEKKITKNDTVKLRVITNKSKKVLSLTCLDNKEDLTYL